MVSEEKRSTSSIWTKNASNPKKDCFTALSMMASIVSPLYYGKCGHPCYIQRRGQKNIRLVAIQSYPYKYTAASAKLKVDASPLTDLWTIFLFLLK